MFINGLSNEVPYSSMGNDFDHMAFAVSFLNQDQGMEIQFLYTGDLYPDEHIETLLENAQQIIGDGYDLYSAHGKNTDTIFSLNSAKT